MTAELTEFKDATMIPNGENGVIINVLGRQIVYDNLSEQELATVNEMFEVIRPSSALWQKFLNRPDIESGLKQFIERNTAWTMHGDWKVGMWSEDGTYLINNLQFMIAHFIVEMYRMGTDEDINDVDKFATTIVTKLNSVLNPRAPFALHH